MTRPGRGRQSRDRPRVERTAFNLDRQAATVATQGATRNATDPPSAVKVVQPAREPRDWAFLGLLGFTLVLFLRPQDLFPPLAALHLAELCAVFGVAALIYGRLARQQTILPLNTDVVAILVFTGVLLALVPFSIWPGGSYAMLTGLFLKVVLIFMLVAGTVTTPARLERMMWVILLASGYLAFRGVFDYARGVNLVENGRVAGAVGGVFGNPNDLAMNMVSFLPPALMLAVRRRGPSLKRLAAAGIAMLMVVTIVFTKSRGGFLGLAVMLLVLAWQGGKIRRGFGTAVLVAIVAGLPLLPSSFWNRMASITDADKDQTGSRESRRTDMREAWWMFLERPITGVGPGQMTSYNPPWRQERWREAHNVFLQVAADDGIFGLLAFSYLVFRAFRLAWFTSIRASAERRANRPRSSAGRPVEHSADVPLLFSTALTASIAGWFVCALFASIAYSWTFYYVYGLAMATATTARADQRVASGAARPRQWGLAARERSSDQPGPPRSGSVFPSRAMEFHGR